MHGDIDLFAHGTVREVENPAVGVGYFGGSFRICRHDVRDAGAEFLHTRTPVHHQPAALEGRGSQDRPREDVFDRVVKIYGVFESNDDPDVVAAGIDTQCRGVVGNVGQPNNLRAVPTSHAAIVVNTRDQGVEVGARSDHATGLVPAGSAVVPPSMNRFTPLTLKPVWYPFAPYRSPEAGLLVGAVTVVASEKPATRLDRPEGHHC